MNPLNRLTTALAAAIVVAALILSPAETSAGIFDGLQLKDLPEAVQKTINAQSAGGEIGDIERNTTAGQTFYQVDVVKDGKRMQFKVAADGRLLTPPTTAAERVREQMRDVRDRTSEFMENDVKLENLPREVQASVKAETDGAKDIEIEQAEEDGLTFYKVKFEKAGKDHAIQVDQTGKVVKRDD